MSLHYLRFGSADYLFFKLKTFCVITDSSKTNQIVTLFTMIRCAWLCLNFKDTSG